MNLDSGGNLNKIVSMKTRKKQSIAAKLRPPPNLGKKASQELKLKLSIAHMGIPNKRKGIKTGKPAWNTGLKGVQKSARRIPISVFDEKDNVFVGVFESIQSFLLFIGTKSKNFRVCDDGYRRIGRYKLLAKLP